MDGDRWQRRRDARDLTGSVGDREVEPVSRFQWLSAGVQPVIVIPGESGAVGERRELIDMVLLHEIRSRAARATSPGNLVHKLVRLVYWPHPLFWPVGRIIGAVREQACDDVVRSRIGGVAAYRASLAGGCLGLGAAAR